MTGYGAASVDSGGKWMLRLADHYRSARAQYPGDRLLIVFDVDFFVLGSGDGGHPWPGVLDVIRWFQLQPWTSAGFATRHPADRHGETLAGLRRLGRASRAEFDPCLLHATGTSEDAALSPSVLRAFAARGFRTFAVVGGEKDALERLVQSDGNGEILYLHAGATRGGIASEDVVVEGFDFDLSALIGEDDLIDHVTSVWHGVNDADNLQQFLASSVPWAECDVRRDRHARLVLHHDPLDNAEPGSEPLLTLDDAAGEIAVNQRGIKVDLKDGPEILADVMTLLAHHRFGDDRAWFNSRIDVLGAEGFRVLRAAFPDAIVQCPVDFLGPLVVAAPDEARSVLETLKGWGIDRYSVAWATEHTNPMLQQLGDWGYDVNVYAVPDLESFLRAALRLPRSVTGDFNFPEWNYHGRGSGERRAGP